MDVLESHVNSSDATFRANRERLQQLVAELRAHLDTARQGGGPKYLQRHREQGKLPVRERIERLLDPGSAFLELSPLAALHMYGGEAPSAGVVTGIGRVSGREVMIVANDATVKGGSYLPLTVKKHVRRLPSPRASACRGRSRRSRSAATPSRRASTRRIRPPASCRRRGVGLLRSDASQGHCGW